LSQSPPTEGSAPSVFINCPFDWEFRSQANAIVFTCVHAGFYPVLATSGGQSGRPRLDRILAGLSACRYSIHDLSRCRGEGEENLARFNMPLELGMAMAIRAGHLRQAGHEYLILVPAELQLYQRYISDLAGLDPQTHDGTPERIVAEVLAWLLTAAEAPAEVDPQEVIDKLGAFQAGLDDLQRQWRAGSIPWPRIVELAARVAREA
jgi:hypothetical protein